MRTLHTKYRVFRILEDSSDPHTHKVLSRLESTTHIEFEKAGDAMDWIKEHGDHNLGMHEYIVQPCIRVIENE